MINFSPLGGEDVLEVLWDVDVRWQTDAENGGVFTVQQEGTIYDVQEELDVSTPGEVTRHVCEQGLCHLNKMQVMWKVIFGE